MAKDIGKRCDFHTHTFFSEGVLCPTELVRRTFVKGYKAIAITDHVDFTNLEHVLKCQQKIKGQIPWGIKVYVGVELTHIPKNKIAELAKKAKALKADLVVVHGETPVEPVEEGTNREAVKCRYVDILAHPGKITEKNAETARKNDIYLELSTRRGHCTGNEWVAKIAKKTGAKLLVNTDAHEPEDLVTQETALQVALDAGLDENEALKVVKDNPIQFMKRLK